jgi:hypothetical protein
LRMPPSATFALLPVARHSPAIGVERHGISNTLGWAIVVFRYVSV